MAFVGFSTNISQPGTVSGRNAPTFNQTRQALELQNQVRTQLGASVNPNEALPPNSPSVLTPEQREYLAGLENPRQRELLQNQLIDQAQAQQIMTGIGVTQRRVQMARQMGLPPSQVESHPPFGLKEPPRTNTYPGMGMNFSQMSFFLNSLMQMMMSYATLGNGFSTFLGGGPMYGQR